MIHHLPIAAHNPKQVAQVLAELFHGEAVPFPDTRYPDSYVAVAFDAYGTVIDVHPFTTELIPRSERNDMLFQCRRNPDASPYTATHAAISVLVSEETIRAIAARAGWSGIARACLKWNCGLKIAFCLNCYRLRCQRFCFYGTPDLETIFCR
jgi:hypothetical protein